MSGKCVFLCKQKLTLMHGPGVYKSGTTK
jgi:hypothetical protein